MTNTREATAAANVATALAHPTVLPAFIGAEHLPALASWPASRAALLIETNPITLARYAANATAAPQLHLLQSDSGACPATAPDLLRMVWHQYDTARLCQQLYTTLPMALPGHTDLDVHRAGDTAQDQWLHQCLAHITPWMLALHQFMQSIATLAAHVRQQPRTNDIIFCGLPEEAPQRDILLGQVRARTHWVPLCPGDINDPTPLQYRGISIAPSPHPAVHAASVSVLRLLSTLLATGAKYIACRNFSICPAEHYLLPLTELTRHTGSTLLAAHSDWFTQNGTSMRGGTMLSHALRALDDTQLRILTMYPDYTARYNDTGRGYSLLPFDYLATVPAQQPPHAQRSHCTTDVLIAHISRIPRSHPIITPWIDGLCAFDDAAPAGPRNQRAHRLLLALHHRLRHLPAPLGTTPMRLLLREFDYVYYSVSRLRAMQAAIPVLAAQHRVQLVGTGWEQIFPADLCAPSITDREQLNAAYRSAGATIFFSSMYDSAVPSPEACVCLASGGFPIIAAPSLEDSPTPATWPPVHSNDFAMFARTADLPALVDRTLNDWPARNAHIAAVQARWERTFLPRGQYDITALLQQTYPAQEQPLPAITGHDAIDRAVINASLAFFAEFCGDLALSQEFWHAAAPDLPAECALWQHHFST